jgi:hypothetical protein
LVILKIKRKEVKEQRREHLERELKYIMTGENQTEAIEEIHKEVIAETNKKRRSTA